MLQFIHGYQVNKLRHVDSAYCKWKVHGGKRITRSCEKLHSISPWRVARCSELHFAHNRLFLRVARRPEICRPEWEEAHKVLQEAVSQCKDLAKITSIVRTTSAMPGSSKLGVSPMSVSRWRFPSSLTRQRDRGCSSPRGSSLVWPSRCQ